MFSCRLNPNTVLNGQSSCLVRNECQMRLRGLIRRGKVPSAPR